MQNLDRFAQLFSQEFSGLRAKRTVGQLTQLHRIQASPGLSAAVDLMHQAAEAAGLANVQVHRYLVDGKSYWWTWKKPWFWSPQSAELRLITPEEEILARFEDEPCHLGTVCAPTPPGGITAEVVDVGQGLTEEDYESKDVAGKAVLVSGAGWGYRAATKMAALHGAVGVITDSIVEVPPARTRENAPEQIAYGRVWVEDDGASVFCFGINYWQMQRLKKLVAEGSEPQVHATVETTLSEGEFPVLTGVIEGASKPDEEVLFIAHICHTSPGANDNASGSALILEIARTWCRLIAEGKLPRPARTIRFLWAAEWYGTMAYLYANPDWPVCLQGVICCDMVGENQQLCGGPLVLERTPDTLPSYLNDLGERFLERLTSGGGSYFSASAADLWKYQVGPYGGGSDNAPFVDSTWGVPAISLGHWPDRFYHSSHDTLDKVDPAEMEKVAWVASQLAQVVANAGPSEATLLARETLERGLRRLSQEANEALWALHQLSEDEEDKLYTERIGARIRQSWDALDYRLEVEKGAVASVQQLADDDSEVAALIAACQAELEDKMAQLRGQLLTTGESLAGAKAREAANLCPELSEQEREADRLVPVRYWTGPLDVLYYPPEVLGWEKTAWLVEHMTRSLGVFTMLGMAALWVDGKRSLLEISRRVALGTGMEVDLEVLLHYFRDLAEIGIVSLQER